MSFNCHELKWISLLSELKSFKRMILLWFYFSKLFHAYEGFCSGSAKHKLTFTRLRFELSYCYLNRKLWTLNRSKTNNCCKIIKLSIQNHKDHALDNCLFDLSDYDNVYHIRQVSATSSFTPSTIPGLTIGKQGNNEWCIVDKNYIGEDFVFDQDIGPPVKCNYTTTLPPYNSVTSASCLEKYETYEEQWLTIFTLQAYSHFSWPLEKPGRVKTRLKIQKSARALTDLIRINSVLRIWTKLTVFQWNLAVWIWSVVDLWLMTMKLLRSHWTRNSSLIWF